MVLDTNKTPCVGHLLCPWEHYNLWDVMSLLSSSLPFQTSLCYNELKIMTSVFFLNLKAAVFLLNDCWHEGLKEEKEKIVLFINPKTLCDFV